VCFVAVLKVAGLQQVDTDFSPIHLKPHCIRCSHFTVDDVSALEAISKPPVCIVEDNVTASLAMTLFMAWMP
jgi:hypothetical protein